MGEKIPAEELSSCASVDSEVPQCTSISEWVSIESLDGNFVEIC